GARDVGERVPRAHDLHRARRGGGLLDDADQLVLGRGMLDRDRRAPLVASPVAPAHRSLTLAHRWCTITAKRSTVLVRSSANGPGSRRANSSANERYHQSCSSGPALKRSHTCDPSRSRSSTIDRALCSLSATATSNTS